MSFVFQDVLYPVEAVVREGGYVVHQVTAADSLRTGDQVQLNLDQVHTSKNRHHKYWKQKWSGCGTLWDTVVCRFSCFWAIGSSAVRLEM